MNEKIHSLLPEIESIIRETGTFIRSEAEQFELDKVEKKGSNDLVSYVDKTAEEMLKSRFKALLPGAGFINEEGEDEVGTNGWRWIIDPLDGTSNFVHGVPVYAISVALQLDEETELGIVYELNQDEFFRAMRGEGATVNDRPIQTSNRDELSQWMVATGFPYRRSGRLDAIMTVLKRVLENCRGVRRLGSAAVDLANVACGRVDAYYEKQLNSWDIAAGILLVQEAGGSATDWKGTDNPVFGKQIVATNGKKHGAFLAIINPESNSG